MVTSNNGINLIKKFEGCRLTAYQDSVGVWTIGYGHTKGVKKGQTITEAQATTFLKSDLSTAEKYVMRHNATYNFNQNQFDALVSFTFNCGGGNLSKLTNNDKRTIAEISEKILSYNKGGGKVLNGLTRRRKAEKELFDKAVTTSSTSSSSSSSTYYPAYTGKSQNIDIILKEIGVPAKYYGSIANRRALVVATGGSASYSGTYKENLFIINVAKAGQLKRVN